MPHVAELNRLAVQWRASVPERRVPWFDPDDAGTRARVLVLMEAPGPRTLRDSDGGFCSEDNDDATAETFAQARRQSGLPRTEYVKWNIVPWPLYASDGSWRAPGTADLAEGRLALAQLVSALPELSLVITMGHCALTGYMRYATLQPSAPVLPVLGVPHPSQRNTHARAEALRRIGNALSGAAKICASAG